MRVVDYWQGKTLANGPVKEERSNPNAVMELETGNDESNFFSLGFEGWIVVEFEYMIRKGDTLVVVVEDTWGRDYPPETADVYLSQDGIEWVKVGEVTNQVEGDNQRRNELPTGSMDLDWARYVKVTDTSKRNDFAGIPDKSTVDGFDVNAIMVKNPVIYHEGNWNPGDITKRAFYVTNVGTKDIYVRAWFEEKWYEYNDTTGEWEEWEDARDVVTVTLNNESEESGWREIDPYFYYYNSLNGTYDTGIGDTVKLLVDVNLDGPNTTDEYQGRKYELSFNFGAVQSSNYASVSEWGWSPQ